MLEWVLTVACPEQYNAECERESHIHIIKLRNPKPESYAHCTLSLKERKLEIFKVLPLLEGLKV
ncbi:hypothetical protein BDR05DRAFT_165689 [Suillus weaverae]|nr:hypothetical protein BDR05DRAFT_165689 [Suillus weaverae]